MNKSVKIILLIILILLIVCAVCIFIKKKEGTKKIEKGSAKEFNIVPTMNDEIGEDGAWCGTFQLVWNDLKNEFVKKDVIFLEDRENKMVKNLNEESFKKDMISDNYYYTKFGPITIRVKEEIEKAIKEKFNQESDILNNFDWKKEEKKNMINYIFYAMLYREFEFLKEFDNLGKGKFANKYNDVEYFGIGDDTEKEVGEQITVLYYNSKDDFAVKIATKNKDDVIFCKNPEGKTFKEIYENMMKKEKEYDGIKNFGELDKFKAPKLKFNKKREYTELEEKAFETADPNHPLMQIEKAIQTIQFEINEKGGKVKSEAGIAVKLAAAVAEDPREMYLDDTFTLFLKEEEKDTPYFAAKITDISKFK